jgi:hypothetical protein
MRKAKIEAICGETQVDGRQQDKAHSNGSGGEKRSQPSQFLHFEAGLSFCLGFAGARFGGRFT